jgi:hypothetical protein
MITNKGICFLRLLAFAASVRQTYMNIAALTVLDPCDQFEDTKQRISKVRKVKDSKSIKVGAFLAYHKPADDFKR